MESWKKISADAVKLWIVFFAAGILVLFFRIGHESIWFDESYSAALVRHTVSQIWSIAGQDSHPPLYFILLRFYSLVFGNSLTALRSFSAIAVILLALLGPFGVRRALGTRTALIYTFLVLSLPVLVSFAQEIRMYTLGTLFVTGAAVYGFLAVRDGKKSDWAKFALFAVAGCYTHYFALLATAVYLGALFVWMMVFRRYQWKAFLITAVVIAAAYVPWLSSLSGQIGRVAREFWIEPLTLEDFWYILISPFDGKFTWFFFAPYQFFLSLALAAWGFGRAFYKKTGEQWLPLLAFSAYFLTIAAGVIASVVIRPVFISRYMVPLAGLFILPVAYGLSSLVRHSFIKWTAAVYLVLCLPMFILIHRGRSNGAMEEVAAYLQPKITKETVFLHVSEHTLGTFSYHFPGNRHVLYFHPGFMGYSGYSAFAPNGEVCYGGDLNALLKGKTDLWLVTQPEGLKDESSGRWLLSGKAEPAAGAFYFSIPFSWYKVMVMPIRWHGETADFACSERKDWPADFRKRGEIRVKIRDFRNDDGVAECALFYEEHQADMKDPRNAWQRKSVPIRNGKAEAVFKGLPYGSYSVLVYQDTNSISTNTNFTVRYGYDNWGLSGNFQEPVFRESRIVLEDPRLEIIIPIVTYWRKGLE